LRITSSAGNEREPTGPTGYGAGGPNANQGRIGGTRQVVAASAPGPGTQEGVAAWRAAEREAAGVDTRTRIGQSSRPRPVGWALLGISSMGSIVTRGRVVHSRNAQREK